MMALQLVHMTKVCLTYKNQTSHEAKPTCIDLTLQLLMSLLQLGHVTKVYGFISTSISSITIKLCRMVGQHEVILPGR